jgi:NAD(P)-dependent dehydrogenase (short-subunit alcohol dehydrogenase family)
MKGKVIVITGATSGIGEVAARKLARMGARIVLGWPATGVAGRRSLLLKRRTHLASRDTERT